MLRKFIIYCVIVLSPTVLIGQSTEIWGVTSEGGLGDLGTIYKTDENGLNVEVVHSFMGTDGLRPYTYGGPMLASDNKIYGATAYGGTNGKGVIFSFDPTTKVYEKLYDFDDASGWFVYARLTQGANGKLYGTTSSGGSNSQGTLFEFDLLTKIFTKLHDFDDEDGRSSYGELIEVDEVLYGMTYKGGTSGVGVIFKYDFTDGYSAIYEFTSTTSDGANPFGGLLYDEGRFLGLTSAGGVNGKGCIFEFDLNDGYTQLHDFDDTNGSSPKGTLVKADNGNFYGMTQSGGGAILGVSGVIFEYAPELEVPFSKLYDLHNETGDYPYGSLIADGGNLYGVTYYGSGYYEDDVFVEDHDRGSVFKFEISGNTFTKLYKGDVWPGIGTFTGTPLLYNDKLYGFASNGYPSYSVMYSYDLMDSEVAVEHKFVALEGEGPRARLIQASNKKIYGTTTFGGEYGDGVIFEYDPFADTHTALHSFDEAGGQPYGGLTEMSDGIFFGATYNGGANGDGALFRYTLETNTFEKFHDFNEEEAIGDQAISSLVELDGLLYGTTSFAGTNGGGSIYSVDPNTLEVTVRHEFDGISYVTGDLVPHDGKLYGTGYDEIFKFDPADDSYTSIGTLPSGSSTNKLILASNGRWYGTAYSGGTNSSGVLFEFDEEEGDVSIKFNFDGVNHGKNPRGGMIELEGVLYGTTYSGGANSNYGTFFKYDLTSEELTRLHSFNWATDGLGSRPFYTTPLVVEIKEFPALSLADEDKVYGDEDFEFSVDSDSDGTITYATSDAAVLQITDQEKGSIHGIGEVEVTAYQAESATHYEASAKSTVTISKGQLTVSASDQVKSEGEANPLLTFTYSGFVYGDTENDLDAVPVATTTAEKSSEAGSYPITISGGESAKYNFSYQSGTLIIEALPLGVEPHERFQIYPNPTADELFIEKIEDFEISFYDSQGRFVEVGQIHRDEKSLIVSLRSLEPGIYFASLSSEEESYQFRLIKR
ncbi:choice-of-anchor tandem repeat GloVer-containing protein [Reichenbachiella sp.]|uniref:choice-of-anchor tandem repeat GloVer-containing protein n=1 Tax=Reichenbachiella sp. TaxID=2184521 RepID=UPI003B5B2B85